MDKAEILKKYFGYDKFRSGQEEIIASILAGKEIMAILPTGAGKSICYQIPALMGKRFSIVISPLIALMKDQVDNLNKNVRFAAFINSTIDFYESEQIFNDINNGNIKLLYVAPEKLETTNFADKIKNLNPEYLFVDEAHCISEWGHNFRPSFRRIPEFCEYVGIKNISAFTATATPEVREDIAEQLGMVSPDIFVRGFERENLFINIERTSHKKEHLAELLRAENVPAIVYCSTRKNSESVTDYLKVNGINCECYHAGMTSALRKMIQDDFVKGRIDVIVATNAFGMGIDKADIKSVIHYNMPGSLENYYQEIGRAGRDGSNANVTLLFEERDIAIQNYFIENSNPGVEDIIKVYTYLCDYHKVAVGQTGERSLEITPEITKFLKQREISSTLLDTALKVLEKDEFIAITGDASSSFKVKFTLTSQDLKAYLKKIAAKDLKTFVIEVIREYGNIILTTSVRFDHNKITQRTGFSKEQINSYLDRLESTGIVDLVRPSLNRRFTLTKPRIDSKYLNPDLSSVTEHINRLKKKLDMMTSFVYHENCKTNFILKYFGEDKRGYKCGHCSSCKTPVQNLSSDFVADKILQTLHESRSNITRREMPAILRGTTGKEFYQKLSTFATCKHFGKEQIEKTLFELEKTGSIINVKDLLKLGDKGKDYFTGTAEIKQKESDSDYNTKLVLFNQLSDARKAVARRFNQNPKMICSDQILQKLIDHKPRKKQELLEVQGFTQKIYNKVGEEFLEILKGAAVDVKETELPMQAHIPENIKGTYDLLQKGYGIKDIANMTKQPETIISLQIESIMDYDGDVSVDHLFYENEYEIIRDAINMGSDSLRELKEALPDNISFAKLRIALAKHKAN